ncbi:MAG: ATP-binding protein [Bauldia sp.]
MPLAKLWRRRGLLGLAAAILLLLVAAGLASFLGAAVALGLVAGAVLLVDDRVREDIPAETGTAPIVAPLRDDLMAAGIRRLASALPDPAFILDAGAVVRHANDRAVATFGINEGEFLPARLRYPELAAAFDKVVKGAGPQQVQFAERVPAERSFAAWFAPLDHAAAPSQILLLLDDLTAIQATDRMRADFVANASHELRTPLASLAGFIETLQGPARDDDNARAKFLGIMHSQATRMSRLIDDLLSLSRVEMRVHVRPRDPVDLVAVLGHVADTMAPLAKELGVAIELEVPPAKVIVRGDRDELVQVFNNLVENACKYGQAGRRVIVRLTAPERHGACSVTVADFGPGIPAEHVPRLTERFYRVDGDDSRRHRGTGLGLAIVKHIVTRHRGRLQIESVPGQGSEFTVHLPDAETTSSGETPKD